MSIIVTVSLGLLFVSFYYSAITKKPWIFYSLFLIIFVLGVTTSGKSLALAGFHLLWALGVYLGFIYHSRQINARDKTFHELRGKLSEKKNSLQKYYKERDGLKKEENSLRDELDAVNRIFRISNRISQDFQADFDTIIGHFKEVITREYFHKSALFTWSDENKTFSLVSQGNYFPLSLLSSQNKFLSGDPRTKLDKELQATVRGAAHFLKETSEEHILHFYPFGLPLEGKSMGYILQVDAGEKASTEGMTVVSLLVEIISNAIQRNSYLQEVQKKTRIDGLTSVLNRRELIKILTQEVTRSSRHKYPLAVGFIDLDYFKKINDNFGHQTGDQVLVHVGKLLREISEKYHAPVGRYGGEEFVYIFPERSSQEVYPIMEELRTQVENSDVRNLRINRKITVSIGIYTYHGKKSETLESIIEKSDQALYESKKKGRNQTTIYKEA